MKKRIIKTLILFMALTAGMFFCNTAYAAKTKKYQIIIYKISGRTIKYKKVIDYDVNSDGPIDGGAMKKITLHKKCKYYWYKSDVNKYSRISRKIFTKRVKYEYSPWEKEYKLDWETGELRENNCQYCTIWVKKKKVVKIKGEYRP